MRKRVSRRVLLCFLLLAAIGVASPARADCVKAEAYVEVSGQRQYVVPRGTCVVSTPFPMDQEAGPLSVGNGLIRVGGYVGVPLP